MKKVAIVVTMPHETPENRGRMTKALHLAAGLKDKGAQVKLVFGGRGVEWVPQLAGDRAEGHPFLRAYGGLFDKVRDDVVACNFCCRRFEVRDAVAELGLPIEGEGKDHMALEDYVLDDWTVIPF